MLLFYVCFTLTMYLNKNPVTRPIFRAEIITFFQQSSWSYKSRHTGFHFLKTNRVLLCRKIGANDGNTQHIIVGEGLKAIYSWQINLCSCVNTQEASLVYKLHGGKQFLPCPQIKRHLCSLDYVGLHPIIKELISKESWQGKGKEGLGLFNLSVTMPEAEIS